MAGLAIAVFVALVWAAAVAFARDSRDGRDWSPRVRAGERPSRLGD